LKIADTFSIEQADEIIDEIREGLSLWLDLASQHHLSPTLISTIQQQMVEL
jgi:type II secretory pathway component PulF